MSDKTNYLYNFYPDDSVEKEVLSQETRKILQHRLHKQPSAGVILQERGEESQYPKTATNLSL